MTTPAPRVWKEPISKATVEKVQMTPGTEWKHQLFNIRLQETGELVSMLSREPMFDACRELLARGVTGTLQVWWPGAAYPAMNLDIEGAAKLTILEDRARGPEFATWKPPRPFTEADRARLRARGKKDDDILPN